MFTTLRGIINKGQHEKYLRHLFSDYEKHGSALPLSINEREGAVTLHIR